MIASRRWFRLAGVSFGLAGLAWGVVADAGSEADEILRRAFARRYGCEEIMQIELTTRNRFGEVMRRTARAASKRVHGRCHALARLKEPPFLRGMALLTIENPDRADDQLLYLPSLGRVRRISTGQRGDSFLGTDLSYEDLERLHVADYDVGPLRKERIEGEWVDTISAVPRFESSYERVEFYVARADRAILETRYYQRDTREPYKVIRSPRSGLRRLAGRLIPTRIWAEDHRRGTETELRISEISLAPELDDALFSVASLESERPIPGGASGVR